MMVLVVGRSLWHSSSLHNFDGSVDKIASRIGAWVLEVGDLALGLRGHYEPA
jgi:hypothetical protein